MLCVLPLHKPTYDAGPSKKVRMVCLIFYDNRRSI